MLEQQPFLCHTCCNHLMNRPGSLKTHGFMLIEASLRKHEAMIFNAEGNAHAAITAMRAGFKQIFFSGEKAVFEKLKSIAETHDVVMKDTVEILQGEENHACDTKS